MPCFTFVLFGAKFFAATSDKSGARLLRSRGLCLVGGRVWEIMQ